MGVVVYNCIILIMSPCDLYAFISISGNTEIGNGYGVPGGGAYYDASKLNTAAGKYNSKIIRVMLLHPFNIAITEPASIP